MLDKRYKKLVIPAPANGEGHAIEANRHWNFDGPLVRVSQGWKLYVSATLNSFLETLEAVRPIFKEYGVSYKYISSDKMLRKQNAGLYGYSQVGKLIVAYLDPERPIEPLLTRLKQGLDAFRGTAPVVPFAQELGGGLPLFYRYGAFSGDHIVVNGETIEDDRTECASEMFDDLGNPFLPFHEPPQSNAGFDEFLSRFPVYEVLGQGGKGGVFAAFDTEAPVFTDIILKVGYRNGQVMPDGRDGIDLLERERRFFELLEEHGLSNLAPQMQAHGSFGGRNVIAMSRINGENLLNLREKGELQVRHLQACFEILDKIHDAGLYLGDAKLANFLLDEYDRVWAIDFECAGEIGQSGTDFDLLRTFHFYKPTITDIRLFDKVHLLYSVLHRKDKVSFSETDRIIEISRFLERFSAESDVEKWADRQLRSIIS